jgi:hypothetical protein
LTRNTQKLPCVFCSGGTKAATGSRQVDMSRTYSYFQLLSLYLCAETYLTLHRICKCIGTTDFDLVDKAT